MREPEGSCRQEGAPTAAVGFFLYETRFWDRWVSQNDDGYYGRGRERLTRQQPRGLRISSSSSSSSSGASPSASGRRSFCESKRFSFLKLVLRSAAASAKTDLTFVRTKCLAETSGLHIGNCHGSKPVPLQVCVLILLSKN